MWLFPWRGRRVLQGSRSCAFPCRLGEMGCRVPRGAEWRGGGIIESKLPGSAKQSDVPEACPAPRSSLWLASREKPRRERAEAEAAAAAPLFALLSISQRYPPPTPTPQVQVDLIKWTGTVHCRRRFPALIKWDLTHQWAHIQSSAVFFENIILVSSFTQTLRCLQTAPQMVPFCEHTDWMPLCKCIFGWLSSPESGRLLCGWHAGLEEKGSALLLTCVCVCLSSQYEFHSLLLLPLSEECTPFSIQYYDSLSLNCFLRGPCSPYLGKLAALPLMHRDGVKFF